MLIVVKNNNFTTTALYAALSSASALFVVYLFALTKLTISSAIVQFLIFALPWVFYQLIRLRHNEKLGYLALVSSWVFLEWMAAQYIGKWLGLQLGHAAIVLPFLVQWYEFLGISAGTVWILAINIHISRIILPAQSYTRKQASMNGILVLLLPVIVSICWTDHQKTGSISGKIIDLNGRQTLILDNNEVLSANEKRISDNLYESASDTVENATITNAKGEKSTILARKVRIGSIGGVKNQFIVTSNFNRQIYGLVNGSSLLRADLIRLYALEKCSLLICIDDDSNVSPAIAVSRAMENNLNILVLKKDRSQLYLKTGAQMRPSSNFNLDAQKHGFFSLYGDLTGRLSIFVSIWMLLGTIVKPFRKK